MKTKRKFQTHLTAFGLSATLALLNGCGEKEFDKTISLGSDLGNSELFYEENTISGTISYSNLEQGYLKIVTLSYKGKELEPKLMAIHLDKYRPMRGGGGYDTLNYIDLDTGVTLLSYLYPNYYDENETPEIIVGDNFKIVKETNFFDFIVEENWYQEEYDVNELIEFYNSKTNDFTLIPKLRQNISLTSAKNRNKINL